MFGDVVTLVTLLKLLSRVLILRTAVLTMPELLEILSVGALTLNDSEVLPRIAIIGVQIGVIQTMMVLVIRDAVVAKDSVVPSKFKFLRSKVSFIPRGEIMIEEVLESF